MALTAARAALEKQAEGVVVMDLRVLSTVTDFFVVCTAGSARQITALKDHIETALEQEGCSVWHTEGTASFAVGSGRSSERSRRASALTSGGFTDAPQWVLMDCGDVVVHLLDQRARAFYRLEELWADAPRLSLGGES